MRFDAPIPGANFTADTRNYSWHRPPDLVDYDEAVGYMIDKIDEPEQIEVVYAMLGIDAHITTVVSTLLLQAVSKGKIGIDLAILIAGPLARYIEIAAKDVGIKYEMGIEDKDRVVLTPTLLRASIGLMDASKPEPTPQTDEADTEASPEAPVEGLMTRPDTVAAPEDEQAAMLGAMVEEEPENEL